MLAVGVVCMHVGFEHTVTDFFVLIFFFFFFARTLFQYTLHPLDPFSFLSESVHFVKKKLIKMTSASSCHNVVLFHKRLFFLSAKCTESIPHFSMTLRRIPSSLCLPLLDMALNSTVEHICFFSIHRA